MVVLGALLGATTASGAMPADSSAAFADSLATTAGPRVRAWQVGLLRPDRLQHASLSFTIAAGANVTMRRPATAFAFTLSLGLVKEIWDSRHDSFDATDFAADVVGAWLGVSVPHSESR